jgi:hypothetical protein
MSLELTTSVFIPWGEFSIEMLASCWCYWLVPNWHLFYCLAAVQILQTNNVEVISYYPSQTHWMYSFWAFIEALGLIGYLDSVGGASWWPSDRFIRRRYEPIGWRDAVFLAQLYYLDANTKYWRVLSMSHWLWGVGWGEWYMIMLFVCRHMCCGPFRYWHPFCRLAALQIVQTNNV